MHPAVLSRSFGLLVIAACIGCSPAARSSRTESPPAPATGRELTHEEQARHALNRLAFGPRPGDVERVSAMGVDAWIERQLSPATIDDGAMERQLGAFPAVARTAGELYRLAPPPALRLAQQRRAGNPPATPADSAALRRVAREGRQFAGQLLAARVARAVASERQLHEVLADFWLNHFSVFIGKGQLRYHLADYERDAIRPHVLGRFRDLLGAVARSPAMLTYLDNAQSVADSGQPTLATTRDRRRQRLVVQAIERRRATMTERERAQLEALQARRPRGLNENYARELLELHALGVDGGYTQQDIIAVARAFTGWTVRPPRSGDPGFWFNGAAHDAAPKVVLGTRLAGGRGLEDGEQVLDLLARHPATARFIAGKLATRFVSDSPPPALVTRAAEVYARTDGDLRAVVRTIVTSPEFFAREAYRAKVKSPFEVVVSAARALGGTADTTPATALVMARLGQPLYGHQAPDGWPETGGAWMNTGAILARINFGLMVAANRLPGARVTAWPHYQSLRTATRDVQVERVVEALLGGTASPETRAILRSGENPLLASARDSSSSASDESLLNAMTADDDTPRPGRRTPMAVRSGSVNAPPALAGLAQVIGLALGSPEFQRR